MRFGHYGGETVGEEEGRESGYAWEVSGYLACEGRDGSCDWFIKPSSAFVVYQGAEMV